MDNKLSSLDIESSRRLFLHQALSTAGVCLSAGAVAVILSSCETNETLPTPPVIPNGVAVRIADYPKLSGPGTIVIATIDEIDFGTPVFISQVDATTFAVFSTICTHLGCSVSLPFTPGQDCFCPCHASEFSPIDGSVTRGPAPTNLKAFASTFDAGTGILSVEP